VGSARQGKTGVGKKKTRRQKIAIGITHQKTQKGSAAKRGGNDSQEPKEHGKREGAEWERNRGGKKGIMGKGGEGSEKESLKK